MKKTFFILFAIVFLAAPIVSFGQSETKPEENTKQESKISYTFINEYGFYFGGGIGFTGIFVNGIRFNKTQDCIGIGVGYEIDTRGGQGMPLYVNYRHYFPNKSILKPLINVGVGAKLYFDKYYWGDPYYYGHSYSGMDVTPGMYATVAGGFKVKFFSLAAGGFLKSFDNDFYAGLEVKVGFTF